MRFRSPGPPVALRCTAARRPPGEGRWDTVLFIDGNVGIGGDPIALLRRVRQLLAPAGAYWSNSNHPDEGRTCRSGPNPPRRRGSDVVVSVGAGAGRNDWGHRGCADFVTRESGASTGGGSLRSNRRRGDDVSAPTKPLPCRQFLRQGPLRAGFFRSRCGRSPQQRGSERCSAAA